MELPLLSILVLVGGLIGLGIGAELTINCSIKTAWRFGFSPFLIGLTLVSIGTSIPEIAVGISGGINKLAGLETSGIVVGNYVGSVLNQMTIILGICGLLGSLIISKKIVKNVGIGLLGSLLIFFIVIIDGEISILEGYLLITFYVVYIGYSIFREKRLESADDTILEDKVKGFKICKMEQPAHLDLLLLLFGIIAVALGSDAVVKGGIELATFLNVEQSVIGFIFVGFGTGIPELIVSVRALRKGDVSLSVGNLLGSCISDILLATGIGSVISGFIVTEKTIWIITPITILTTFMAVILLRTDEELNHKESIFLIVAYFLIAVLILTM